MAKRYSVVTTDPMTGSGSICDWSISTGQAEACLHSLDQYHRQPALPGDYTTEEVARRVVEVSKKCVEEDGAELIIPGAPSSGPLDKVLQERPCPGHWGSVIDPQIVAFNSGDDGGSL